MSIDYQVGPCDPWITVADVDCSVADPVIMQAAVDAAIDMLFHLSGMQFTGECAYVVRPGHETGGSCGCDLTECATKIDGAIVTCGSCGGDTVRLGFDPVISVTSVTIDGVVLAANEYEIVEHDYLRRISGDSWPSDDTWEVEFVAGIAPPPSGILAAKVLTCELATLLAGESCQLPQRVTNLTRQGVGMVFDSMDFLNEGRTGLFAVDLFLTTHNPDALRSTAIIAVPGEEPQARRTTWP